jgi:hypothetical protein
MTGGLGAIEVAVRATVTVGATGATGMDPLDAAPGWVPRWVPGWVAVTALS